MVTEVVKTTNFSKMIMVARLNQFFV